MRSSAPKTSRAESHFRRRRRAERGYALLLMLMFVALLLVGTMALVPSVRTEGRREKETEMIWRGKQYVRGIRLYYQKVHKFPTELEDLYKPKTGIRFMRQGFKDPMNPVDGSWRLIYVGPNGRLIGSLKNRSVNGMGLSAQGFGSSINPNSNASGTASSFGNSSFGNSSFGNSSFANSSFGNSSFGGGTRGNASFAGSSFGGSNTLGSNANPVGPGSTAGSNDSNDPNAPNADASSDEMSTPQSLAASDQPVTIIGGNIIGVGSKVNQKSFRWYEKAKNYRQFEFIWDPSVDSLSGQRAGSIPNNPNSNSIGTPAGSSPFSNSGSTFSTGTPNANSPNADQNPSGTGEPPLNPPPDPNQNPPLQAPPQP